MFLDIGVGILTATFISFIFSTKITAGLIFFAIIFALLPDADFLYFYPQRKDTKYDHKHRDIIHYPLLYLPIGTVIMSLLLGNMWATTFLIASFFHFLHDSIAIGWGIKWLYPFSKNNFSFFYLYSKKEKKGIRKLLFSFNEENLPEYVREHGDKDWIANIYYKWHPIAIFEFCVFILSVIVLMIYAKK